MARCRCGRCCPWATCYQGRRRAPREEQAYFFTPHLDAGDFVVVINAEKVKLTGKKEDQKTYMSYSGYFGGERYRSVPELRQSHPDRLILHAVKGMLPKNRLGRKLLTKLKVYRGTEHPHSAQQPQELSVGA